MVVTICRMPGVISYSNYIIPKFKGHMFWLDSTDGVSTLSYADWQRDMDIALLRQPFLMRLTTWRIRTLT